MKESQYKNELTTKYVIAEKILCSEKTEHANLLLKDTPPQAALGVSELCTIQEGGFVLLDFGEELCGGMDVTVQETEGERVQMRFVFGESAMEAMSYIGEKNATNDHSLRDMTVSVANYSNFRVGQTGFRFVRLEAVGGTVRLGGARAAFVYRDLEYQGSFETNDALLNQIWRVGARTVHLNMQEYLWDGVKRDRLVWVGDMHAEVSAIATVFGRQKVVEDSLSLIRDITPSDAWMNNIPSYSFWWLIIQRDWFWYTGNRSYLTENEEYILQTIRNVLAHIRDDGSESFAQGEGEEALHYYFVDWETCESAEAKTGFYAILRLALSAAVDLCGWLQEEKLSKECLRKQECLKKACLPKVSNRQIASLAALAGLEDAKHVNEAILCQEPIEDISAFLGYYTLLAKGAADDVGGALEIVKRYWGRMIELGATSFWESFSVENAKGAKGIDCILQPGEKDIHGDFGAYCYQQRRCSLCHGWACGPTPFLSRYVLGVQPLSAGCKELLIHPRLAGLDYVKGSFPTPYGSVSICAKQTKQGVQTEICAPKEITIVRGKA